MIKSNKFCVWHIGRCGSTVLSSMLNQHPQINSVGEILERYSNSFKNLKYKPGSWTIGQLLVKYMMLCNRDNFFGFEIKVWHLFNLGISVKQTMEFMNQTNVQKHILLTRENYLRILVSSYVAKQSLVWHIDSNSKHELIPIIVRPDELMYAIQEFSEFFTTLKSLLGDNYLWLIYEKDFYHNPKIACNKVTDFLNLERIDPEVRLGITNPYSLKKMIVNYEEISNLLNGTDYEWMLENH